MNLYLLASLAFVVLGAVITAVSLALRRVVPTNEVHIVQSAKKTTSYGKDTNNGNTYYEWPSSLPFIGITKITLPVSVFNIFLQNYEAYDKGRLPFSVDVMAFFRICDSGVAAQRVSSAQELRNQLTAIVQGAVRTVLAGSDIEEIMVGRAKFGEAFTAEVSGQLSQWGVVTVKNLELMDLRDGTNGQAIHNIMSKKKSHIEMESRVEVAKNNKLAQIAEVEAEREVDLQKQQALQAVGLREVETEQAVSLAAQASSQAVKEAEKLTKEKEMNVLKVKDVRTAEIAKEVSVVQAQQNRETAILVAQGQKDKVVLEAEGRLEGQKREAEAIALTGKAKADAERAMLLAPVEAQTTLAKEIGSNESYQKYLITIRQVEAQQAVGTAQAKALEQADVKVISNTGSPTEGLTGVMDLFSSKGGTALASALEALGQSDKGQALLTTLTGGEKKAPLANGAGKTSTKSNGAATN